MKSVFISSTRVDLIPYRAAVDAAVRRLEQRPINMDDFGSQPGGAANTSVREVDKGDIYIGILAHRYGYVPAGMDRSVTEQEYDRAVERNMPRLLYLVDPAYAWPDEFIEKDDPAAGYSAQEKLNQFKAKVNKAEVRSLFTTPDDLSEKVTIDLVNLLGEERHQQRFFRVLAAAVIVIVALIVALITIPGVRSRVVEIAGVASPTSTHIPTATSTLTPSPTFTPSPPPTATATPLEGTPFAQGDVGVVFADFDVIDVAAPHTERNIERELQSEQIPFIHVHHTISARSEAQQIAQQYKATIVIWGEVALGGVALNFEVNAPSAGVETTISGLQVSATQLENFSAYIFQGMDVLYIVDFIRGQVAYFANDNTGALTLFNSAVERIPAGREKDLHAEVLHFYRGNVYYAQQDDAHALDDYTQAIQLAPNEAPAYINRAIVYDEQQDYAHAVADYTEAIRIDPKDAQAYYGRGIVYNDQQDFTHALADYTEAIRLNPNLEVAYVNRGLVYEQLQNNDSALVDFNQAIRLDPNDIQAYGAQGSLYLSQRDFVHAHDSFSLAVEIAPNNEQVYMDRGLMYFRMEDYPHAVADFSQVIRINPKSALGYRDRATAYYAQNDTAHALDDYTQAIQLDPTDVHSYQYRGMIYLSLTSLETDAAKRAQLARHAIADLRQAQTLGYPLPSDVELAVTQLEAQLGDAATVEATDLPTS